MKIKGLCKIGAGGSIKITDSKGNTIISKELRINEDGYVHITGLSGLVPGNYQVMISAGTQIQSRKLLINE